MPIEPKGVWRREGDTVYLCGTLGAAFDTWQRARAAVSAAEAYSTQRLGLEEIEREMDRLESEARAALAPGEKLLPRRSPGYGELPLALSREILAKLDATKRLGVSVTDSELLVPSKSVTAICKVVAAPTVSVVIPTYNRADAAVHCARSVLASDFAGGIEIVIVDDCSSKCIVADHVHRELGDDPRIKVIRHERNKNTAAAHNTGGYAARGKYIFFLDDDNELKTDVISKLVAVLERGEHGLVAPLAVNVTPEGEKTVWAKAFEFNRWTSVPKNADANVPYTDEYERGMSGRLIDSWYSPNGYMMPKAVFERWTAFTNGSACTWRSPISDSEPSRRDGKSPSSAMPSPGTAITTTRAIR